MQKIMGTDVAGGRGVVIRDTESGEVRMLKEDGTEEMVFGEHVVFESESYCSRCQEVQELVRDLGLEEIVSFLPSAMIELHPERGEIMAELALQDMELPVAIFTGKVVGVDDMVARLMDLVVEDRDTTPLGAGDIDFGLDGKGESHE